MKIQHSSQAVREKELIQHSAKDLLERWRIAHPGYPTEEEAASSSDIESERSSEEIETGSRDDLMDGWESEASVRYDLRQARRDLRMAKSLLRKEHQEHSRGMARFFFMYPQATMEAWRLEYRKVHRDRESFGVRRDRWESFVRETGEDFEKTRRAAQDDEVGHLPFLAATLASRSSDANTASAPQVIRRSVARHMNQSGLRRETKRWRRRVARYAASSVGSDDKQVPENLRSRGEPVTLFDEDAKDREARLSQLIYQEQEESSIPTSFWRSLSRTTASDASTPFHSGLGGVHRKALIRTERLRRCKRDTQDR